MLLSRTPIAIIQLLSASVIDGLVSMAALENEFERFRAYFLSPTTEGRSFVGVFGVMLVDGPIDLSNGVRLRSVESNDLDHLIQTGVGETSELAPAFYAGTHRTFTHLPDLVAEVRYPIPVRQVEDTDPPNFKALALPDMHSIGDCLVMTLALITPARVARTGVITEELHWFSRGRSWSEHPQRTAVSGALAQLRLSDAERLFELYEQLACEGLANRKYLELAHNRFVLALSRTRDDDSLIDLTIAAEALLMDQGSELSLRLALRAATLAERTTLSPRAVFNRMRRAYRIRSKVVHGEGVDGGKIKAARIDFETDLRALLKAYVQMAAEAGGTYRLTLDEARYLPDTDDSD